MSALLINYKLNWKMLWIKRRAHVKLEKLALIWRSLSEGIRLQKPSVKLQSVPNLSSMSWFGWRRVCSLRQVLTKTILDMIWRRRRLVHELHKTDSASHDKTNILQYTRLYIEIVEPKFSLVNDCEVLVVIPHKGVRCVGTDPLPTP